MKTTHWFVLIFSVILISCGKENRWDVELPQEKVDLNITDISDDFFDTNIPLEQIQSKYPFFFDNRVENSIWENQRRDTLEVAVYDSIREIFADSRSEERRVGKECRSRM